MKDNEVPIAYYKTKLTTEIKEIFGIDVRGQTPVLRLKKSEGMPNFVEIPNLTRDIRIGVRVVCANKGMVETPVLAHISVGFRVVKRDPPETLVFKSEHKSERSPVTEVWSVEKAWSDSFFKRDYNELLLLLNRMTLKSGNFLSIVSLVSALTPLNMQQQFSENGICVVSDFANKHFISSATPLVGVFRLKYTSRDSRFSNSEQKIGYIPKAWTLRDLSAWLVVSDRFPTLKEAKQIQSKIHERNDGIQNLEERD